MGIGYPSDKTIVGEMYIIHTDLYDANITVADAYGQLGNFHKGLESDVIVDEVAGTFEIKRYGNYKFDGVASLFPSAGMIIHFAVFLNGVCQCNIETGIDFKNSQDTQTFSGTGWLKNLNPGDIITVRGKSDTVPVTVRINHMNVSIERRGRS